MRKTKIVCTMGPRESDPEILQALAQEMDVARFNFSHGDHESHLAMLQSVRAAAEKAGRPIAMLLDTKGPEIRTGLAADPEGFRLEKGARVVITTETVPCTAERISVSYAGLPQDVTPGGTILIDDGNIELRIDETAETEILCTVITGGHVSSRKGVNVPGTVIRLPGVTDKDVEDIRFGADQGFDYIAASFVRDAETIRRIRGILEEKGSKARIIAKLESHEGVANIDEIIEASDGIMVARGDLGVEIEAKKIPQLQREMIRKCNATGKLVITATQMLDSMIRNPRPTRAEVTDVANAVYEGSDAVMLSGETASGDYPVEALRMMASIAEYTEQFPEELPGANERTGLDFAGNIAHTTCHAAVTSAEDLHARAIIAPTSSGATALLLSKLRPASEIYALSPDPAVVRQMMLFRGVFPVLAERALSTDELMEDSLRILRESELLQDGDLCVFTAGVISGRHKSQRSSTNIMRILEV
ncbi:MAG: pyruvate kinase [Mogibacterium sp.]|nr:pyruvate kinase [Mogibacterium sp.]